MLYERNALSNCVTDTNQHQKFRWDIITKVLTQKRCQLMWDMQCYTAMCLIAQFWLNQQRVTNLAENFLLKFIFFKKATKIDTYLVNIKLTVKICGLLRKRELYIYSFGLYHVLSWFKPSWKSSSFWFFPPFQTFVES